MATYKIVHYINQFFAGIGGEEKADIVPEVREGCSRTRYSTGKGTR